MEQIQFNTDTFHRTKSPIDLKIQKLQQISEKQSQKLWQLLIPQAKQTYRIEMQSTLPSSYRQLQTPKQRYHYQEFLEEQAMGRSERLASGREKTRMPLFYPQNQIQLKEEKDQQMQYLKSNEYHQYLKMITQGDHLPGKNLNNQLYQGFFFPKTLRPTVNNDSHKLRHQPIPSFYKCSQSQLRSQIVRSRAGISRSPPSNNPSAQTITKEDKRNQLKRKQQYKISRQISCSQSCSQPKSNHSSSLSSQQCSPVKTILQKQINKKCTILYPSFQHQPMRAEKAPTKSLRMETYRKEIDFCNKQSSNHKKIKHGKSSKRSGKNITDYDQNKENNKSGSASHHIPSSSPSITYQMQFKIIPPNLKQQAKHNLKNTRRPPHQDDSHSMKKPHQRLITEPVRSKIYHPLCESQTNSTTAKTDNHSHRKKGKKISVISKSRLK